MKQESRAEILKEIIKEMLQKIGAGELYSKDLEEIITFRIALSDETDRGCAMMAASFLEYRLGQLLKAYIVNDKKHSKQLFEGNGPLATFSSRINICYSLGLISEAMRSDLNMLRKIRNEFAHNPKIISFSEGNISDRCFTLKFAGINGPKVEPREIFIQSMLGIDGTIVIGMKSLKNITPKKNEDFASREQMFDFLVKACGDLE